MEKLEDIVLKKGDIIEFDNDKGDLLVDVYDGFSIRDISTTHIVKIKRPVKYETIYKRPQEILDKEEKEYLSAVIRPFKNKIEYIMKNYNPKGQWIEISFEDGYFDFPTFKENTMYKGMELQKEYTVEELGL